MKVEIRGIIQWHKDGHKKTRIVFRRDDRHGRRSMMLPDDVKINRGRVVEELGRFVKSKTSDILIPRHIRTEDITEHEKK